MTALQATIDAQVHKVGVSATEKDGSIRRACRLVFFREFDDEVAAALQGDAKKALRSLRDNGYHDVTIPLDGVVTRCTVEVMGKEITIPVLRGVRAKARAAKEERPPLIKLIFGFDFDAEAFAFLGQHTASQARVTFTPAQLSNGLDAPASNEGEKQEVSANGDVKKKGRARRKAAEGSDETTETAH